MDVELGLQIIGQEIKKLREERKLTLKELSVKTGIKEKYLNKIEKGQIDYPLDKLLFIAEALNVELYTLFRCVDELFENQNTGTS